MQLNNAGVVRRGDVVFSARDPIGFFEERTDSTILRSIYRQLLIAWIESLVEMTNGLYLDDIIRYLFPQVLRAKIDLRLFALAPLTPILGVTLEPNKTATAHHALIKLPYAMITASAVRGAEKVVRPAGFRNNYVRLQSQFVIDDKTNTLRFSDEVTPDEAFVYAIVIHGPKQGDRYRNGFVHIVFLDADGVYLPGRIKLEERFPEVLEEISGVEQIKDNVTVPARTRQQQEADKS